jgi:hypothetical protein
MAIESIIPSEQ